MRRRCGRGAPRRPAHACTDQSQYDTPSSTVQRALFGALGLSSGTTPLPDPTNTPLPTTTDCLLPMITLGCGDARLARVPSGQMMASPVQMPRRPSSQVTSVPWRVQFCAMAEEAVATAAAERRSETTSARVIIATVPYWSAFADLAFALLSRRRSAMFGSKRAPNESSAEPNYAIVPTNWGNF